MKTVKELLEIILEETYIMSSALDARDMDIVMVCLNKREAFIEAFNKVVKKPLSAELKKMLTIFEQENEVCVQKLNDLKVTMEVELYMVKSEKSGIIRKQKVHDSYSNPYVGGVGTSFDLKK